MTHPNGGKGNQFHTCCTFDDAFLFVKERAPFSFFSTTRKPVQAKIGKTQNDDNTIVFPDHGNVCHACWGFRNNCSNTRVGHCVEALSIKISQIRDGDNAISTNVDVNSEKSSNISVTVTEGLKPVINIDSQSNAQSIDNDKLDLKKFPYYYKQYSWNLKHKLFGYPPDSYPEFQWIKSLEQRFIWLHDNSAKQKTASKYLLKEMIEWGGSQHGVLQKFNDGIEAVNLLQLVQEIISNLNYPEKAIKSSLNIPGLGLTYATKLLRFMKPGKYGALDSRIRRALLNQNLLPRIYDGNSDSMVNGYLSFLDFLKSLKSKLENLKIKKPDCSLSHTGLWRPSEIEMVLFCWSESQ